MQLKLFLEQTGQSWTLKPNREYIIGSGSDCDISLPYVNAVASKHLKFSFEQFANTWHVYDLGSNSGTFIENQQITNYAIRGQARIAIAGGVFLVATPEGATPNAPPPPPIYTPQTPPPLGAVPVAKISAEPAWGRQAPIAASPLRVMTWGDYVEAQASQQLSWWDRVAIRFYLMTGLRTLLWLKFEGYIIPNFKESAEKIAVGIETNLNQLKRYENTDCNVALLTDAHLTDTSEEVFSGIDLFALKRGGKRDFRRFCIVSHHRIRSYIVVDNYGPDLFIGRLTRFESQPDGFVPGLILGLSVFIALIITFFAENLLRDITRVYGQQLSVGLWLLIIIGGLWAANFLAVPLLMRELRILPRPGNTQVIWLIILLSLWAFFGMLTLLFPG